MPVNYSNYHPMWKESIRPEALKRARHQCEICKVKNKSVIHRINENDWIDCSDHQVYPKLYEGYKLIKIVLTVAHLNHLTWDNRPENLQVLCQLHHLRHDQPHKMAMRRSHPMKKVKELLEDLRAPEGKLILPIGFAKIRALHREYLQLRTIQAKNPKRNQKALYWEEIAERIRVIDADIRLLENQCASILAKEFQIANAKGFVDAYVQKSLSARS